jgi:metal-responsive CopG/Arc/MetJ family transcriptional regulator
MQGIKGSRKKGKWVVVHVNIKSELADQMDALIEQEKAKVPHGKFDRSSVVTGAVRDFIARHLIKEGTSNG